MFKTLIPPVRTIKVPILCYHDYAEFFVPCVKCIIGSAVAQSVYRVIPGKEVLGLITAVAARSLLVGPVSVYYNAAG